jgi:glycosyltransferase involved in cell wall biosynthesis
MRALDLVLLPSWVEPLSRSVIEAMILGTAVLATSRGGPADLIIDGVSGYLAPPREPATWARLIIKLLQDPKLRARAATHAHADILARLDLAGYVAEMTSLYERVALVAADYARPS